MTFAIGQRLTADLLNEQVPRLVGQSRLTADVTALSGSTEAQQTTVTIDAVDGQRYEIRWFLHVSSATSVDTYQTKVREDTGISGTQLGLTQVYCPTTSTVGFATYGSCEYTASATASKTFSLTMQRNGSAGTGQLRAGTSRQAFIQVWTCPQ